MTATPPLALVPDPAPEIAVRFRRPLKECPRCTYTRLKVTAVTGDHKMATVVCTNPLCGYHMIREIVVTTSPAA